MTENGGPSEPAWYDDPTQQGQQRWWDGAAWTNYVQSTPAPPPVVAEPIFAAPGGYAAPIGGYPAPIAGYAAQTAGNYAAPTASYAGPIVGAYGEVVYRDTPSRWGTPAVWAIVFSPLLSGLALVAALVVQSVRQNPQPLLVLAIIILFALLSVLWAVIDSAALTRFGYQDVPHWAWAFLTPLAYLIVRLVKTRAAAGIGGAPLWTHIAVLFGTPLLLGIISAIVIPVFLAQQGGGASSQGQALPPTEGTLLSADAELAVISTAITEGYEIADVACPDPLVFTAHTSFVCNTTTGDGASQQVVVTFGATAEDSMTVEAPR